jgi:hypothetical protein
MAYPSYAQRLLEALSALFSLQLNTSNKAAMGRA